MLDVLVWLEKLFNNSEKKNLNRFYKKRFEYNFREKILYKIYQ